MRVGLQVPFVVPRSAIGHHTLPGAAQSATDGPKQTCVQLRGTENVIEKWHPTYDESDESQVTMLMSSCDTGDDPNRRSEPSVTGSPVAFRCLGWTAECGSVIDVEPLRSQTLATGNRGLCWTTVMRGGSPW
jgi:hypothetical protein